MSSKPTTSLPLRRRPALNFSRPSPLTSHPTIPTTTSTTFTMSTPTTSPHPTTRPHLPRKTPSLNATAPRIPSISETETETSDDDDKIQDCTRGRHGRSRPRAIHAKREAVKILDFGGEDDGAEAKVTRVDVGRIGMAMKAKVVRVPAGRK